MKPQSAPHYLQLHPEIKSQVNKIPRLPLNSLTLIKFKRFLFKVLTKVPQKVSVEFKQVALGSQRLFIYQPEQCGNGTIFWIHGGGHLVGTPHQLMVVAKTMADQLSMTVVLPSYRLAPEHPFPANLDDCYQAWSWLQNDEQLGINKSKIVLAGNSAGGGLAAALSQRLQDGGEKMPVAQVLYYPMLDDRTAANRNLDNEAHFIWNNRNNYTGWSAYLGKYEVGAGDLPDYASPARRENLAGQPPTWIGVGDLDLFYAENRVYHQRLQQAGVPSTFFEVVGVPHAFEMIFPQAQVSLNFQQQVAGFIDNFL